MEWEELCKPEGTLFLEAGRGPARRATDSIIWARPRNFGNPERSERYFLAWVEADRRRRK
jgi:hypothetical protein